MGTSEQRTDMIRSSLRKFLSAPIMPLARSGDFGDDESFLERGVLDSTGVLELVGFIESQFSIRVESDELIPDNLDSINKIVGFVDKKMGL